MKKIGAAFVASLLFLGMAIFAYSRISLDIPGTESTNTLELLNNEIVKLINAGQYEAAMQVAFGAVDEAIHVQGLDHPHVATSLENLMLFYRTTDREAEAEEYAKRAAAIRAKKR